MKRRQARIHATGQRHDGTQLLRIHCPPESLPRPGQALLALLMNSDAFLRHTLYPLDIDSDGFRCMAPPAERWRPGDQLDLLGPIGRGFNPTKGSQRWLLISHPSTFEPLRALLASAEDQDASVAVVSRDPPLDLPDEVEVLVEAEAGIQWADYIAVSLPTHSLSSLRLQFGIYLDLPLPCPAEVLIPDALPCGFGGCLACGLPTNKGWSLRCQHGPVFNWKDLRD